MTEFIIIADYHNKFKMLVTKIICKERLSDVLSIIKKRELKLHLHKDLKNYFKLRSPLLLLEKNLKSAIVSDNKEPIELEIINPPIKLHKQIIDLSEKENDDDAKSDCKIGCCLCTLGLISISNSISYFCKQIYNAFKKLF